MMKRFELQNYPPLTTSNPIYISTTTPRNLKKNIFYANDNHYPQKAPQQVFLSATQDCQHHCFPPNNYFQLILQVLYTLIKRDLVTKNH